MLLQRASNDFVQAFSAWMLTRPVRQTSKVWMYGLKYVFDRTVSRSRAMDAGCTATRRYNMGSTRP
jgi:hypothetical protein